ncbi:AraC family transcriptional regulator [Nocardiopsis sp. NPDC058789]|uniref:AraC family transcriptional regulator n=1 Tax=Nocardiopsis sp. NPDC058789 TaxID=3346634 RepID=UPI00366B2A76
MQYVEHNIDATGWKMIEDKFDTTEVEPSDRFDYWRDAIGKTHAPIHITSDCTDDFRGVQRLMLLDGVLVWPTVFQPVIFNRTSKLIRTSDPECYHFSLVEDGRLEIESQRRTTTVRRHEISLVDTSHPFRIRSAWGLPKQRGIGIEVPKSSLGNSRKLENLIGSKMSTQEGYGALLRRFLIQLSHDSSCYGPRDGERLSTVTIDLISGLLAHSLEEEDKLPMETRENTLLLRIEDFMRSNLGDQELSPKMVAQVHGISTSYLHRIFRGKNMTVNAWLRRERLEGARRDLLDPELDSTPLYHISRKWGFSSASVFSRAYREFYEISPREARQKGHSFSHSNLWL